MILAGALSLTPEAGAQGGQDVEEALRRTDELLQQAAEVVRSADSQRARILLDQAYAIQRNAWTQFQNGHPRLATRLTIEARDLAKRAVRLAREDSSLRTRARRELEKAWDMLQRAREQLGDVSDHAGRLLQEAHQQIERGRSQFQEQNYEPAMRLAISAQRLVRQALGSTGGAGGADRLERELERTDRLIERAREVIAGSDLPEARRALERAMSLQQDAWAAYRSERFRVALAATKEARNLAARVLKLVHGPMSSDRVERALSETDRLLDRAADIVTTAGDDTAARLVERAREHQAQARRLLGDGQLRPALAKTRVAAGLAKRAMRMVEGGGGL
jgi:tetratricopeptide (TPR) repeat protein